MFVLGWWFSSVTMLSYWILLLKTSGLYRRKTYNSICSIFIYCVIFPSLFCFIQILTYGLLPSDKLHDSVGNFHSEISWCPLNKMITLLSKSCMFFQSPHSCGNWLLHVNLIVFTLIVWQYFKSALLALQLCHNVYFTFIYIWGKLHSPPMHKANLYVSYINVLILYISLFVF